MVSVNKAATPEPVFMPGLEMEKGKETVLLRLITRNTNNTTLGIGERAYFDGNASFRSRRITAVEIVPTIFNYINYISLASTTLNPVRLSGYTLTLINKKGRRVIENMPCLCLYGITNFGKIRRFDTDIDIQASYVTNYLIPTVNPLDVIPFQFTYKDGI